MSLNDYWARVQGRYYRTGARLLFKRPFALNSGVPLISFTFDDFPRSALRSGGAILRHYGLNGTYYVSLGLMGKQAPTGSMFVAEDVKELLEQGHELGCHTFSHCHSAATRAGAFEDSIIENQLALDELFPGVRFRTLSYPISVPRPRTKQRVAKYFIGCRGGGQTLNVGTADLNCLSAYFLEKSRDNVESVKDLIRQNQRIGGWLIFATHDISDSPTPYGCTPEFFEQVVRCAISSDARILPVVKVLEALGAPGCREDSTHPVARSI